MFHKQAPSAPVTRRATKTAVKRKAEEERIEREKTRFLHQNGNNSLHVNDICVNMKLGKIKIEEFNVNKVKVDHDATNSPVIQDVQVIEDEQDVQSNDGVLTQNANLTQTLLNTDQQCLVISSCLVDKSTQVQNDLQNINVNTEHAYLSNDNANPSYHEIQEEYNVLKIEVGHEHKRSSVSDVVQVSPDQQTDVAEVEVVPNEVVISQEERNQPNQDGHDIELLNNENEFWTEDALEQFLQKLLHFKGNPFRTKTASFGIFEEISDKYRTLLEQCLLTYGEHLQTVKLLGPGNGYISIISLYIILETCLPHLPNLENLVIGDSNKNVISYLLVQHQDPLFSKYIAQRRFPVLSKLKSLEFLCDSDLIQMAILRESSALEKLTSLVFNKQTGKLLEKHNLKELRYIKLSGSFYQAYDGLIHVNPSLTKLSLLDAYLGDINISEVLRVITRFPKLSHLRLDGNIQLFGDASYVVPDKGNETEQDLNTMFQNVNLELVHFPDTANPKSISSGELYANLQSRFQKVQLVIGYRDESWVPIYQFPVDDDEAASV